MTRFLFGYVWLLTAVGVIGLPIALAATFFVHGLEQFREGLVLLPTVLYFCGASLVAMSMILIGPMYITFSKSYKEMEEHT